MEEGLLPKNTKVVITGNNRTRSFLVGLHAVVKNTAGVRGWHWLVLPNGLEVKLQRNALSVIEMPTGQEEGKQEENPTSNNSSSLDLRGCRDQAIEQEQEDKQDGNLSSNNSSSSSFDLVSDEFQKICEPKSKPCVLGGSSSRNHGREVQSRESNFPSHRMLKVDLSKLETSALWRYWKHFNLVDVGPNSSKDQLVGAVERHFISQQLDELQVISGFVQAAKRLKTVCS